MNERDATGARRLWLIVAAFAALYVIWGSTYLAIRFAIETLPPLGMAGSRFLVAGAIMYAFARWRGTASPTRSQWIAAAVVGVLLLLGGNGLVVLGQRTVASGVAALIIATQSIWIALLVMAVPGARRAGWRAWAGLVLGLAGLVWLLGVDGSGVDLGGAGLLVAASLSWSIGTVVGQGLQKRGVSTPSLVLGTGMQMLAGGAALLVASAIRREWGADVLSASAASAAGWAYLVVFGSIVGFTAYVWLLTQVSASAVATYAFVNPVVAVLLGWGIAGEALSGRAVSAAGVIVAAVAMIILDGWRARNGSGRAGDDVVSSVAEDGSHGSPRRLSDLPAVGDEGGGRADRGRTSRGTQGWVDLPLSHWPGRGGPRPTECFHEDRVNGGRAAGSVGVRVGRSGSD